MRYRPLVKNLVCIVLILALIPALLAIRLEWDAILPIVVYFQFLLLWAQVEVGLRERALFVAQFEPFFDVELESEQAGGEENPSRIYLRNVSKNPAYNIMAGRILDEQNRPIPPDSWKDKVSSDLITSLAPGRKALLCTLNAEIARSKPTIEVSYCNHFGEWGTIYIKLYKKVLLIPEGKRTPGILLNLFEEFGLLFRYFRFKTGV